MVYPCKFLKPETVALVVKISLACELREELTVLPARMLVGFTELK